MGLVVRGPQPTTLVIPLVNPFLVSTFHDDPRPGAAVQQIHQTRKLHWSVSIPHDWFHPTHHCVIPSHGGTHHDLCGNYYQPCVPSYPWPPTHQADNGPNGESWEDL